ncbi:MULTISPECIES: hypothetical protein [unclassified Photobacterium]|uniref:hypothetical protein n=1 Tax=unclassified Photobacterium TaxID=2628852 RepID=UPI001EDEA2A5|nr:MULTISPECIES: hypothetical protein [unclassified Photobacterium]MCG3862588.1 hypothetical protein [Photobacterium sp. Ph6]MCG3874119.1 hypothetical protein [Photobacterium sp. Ph5]
MTYNIGRTTYYPHLSLISVDNQEVTLEFNEAKILNFLINNTNKIITINKIKDICYPNDSHAEDIITDAINNIKVLINSHQNSSTFLISHLGFIYLKSIGIDKGEASFLKRFLMVLSLLLMLMLMSFFLLSNAPKKEYIDDNLYSYQINNRDHTVKIINNIDNNIDNKIIDRLRLLNENITFFYFEDKKNITFSILRENNTNNKSHIVNIKNKELLFSELDRVLNI